MLKIKKKTKETCFYILGVVLAIVAMGTVMILITDLTKEQASTHSLSEIEDGVYAITYSTYSNVPANNYDVVRIYYDNAMHTIQGDVFISYTEESPYIYLIKRNYVNGDEVHLYVPKGSVLYQESVNIK